MIQLAKHLGYCSGVKHAIDTARRNRTINGKVYVLGQLIHNEIAINELKEEGIESIEIEDLKKINKNDILVLKAHGTEKEIIKELEYNKIKYVDAICPVVQKVHDLVKTIDPEVNVYIYGNKNHDEVKALKSVSENGIRKVRVITDKEDIDFNQKGVVVFQTTITYNVFEEVKKYIEEKNSIKDNFVVYYNTICYNTKARQDEIKMLAKSTDMCLVLGSKTSANTNVLYKEGKKVNENTYFISDFSEVQKIKKNGKSVSICSGASTPNSLIQEVICYMSEEVKNQDNISTMDDVMRDLDNQGQNAPGSVVKCRVIRVSEDGLLVCEENAKVESKIPLSEIGSNDLSKYKENQVIEVVYVGTERRTKKYSIKELIKLEDARREIKNALEKGIFKVSFYKFDDKYFYGKLGKGNWAYKVIAPIDEVIFSKKMSKPSQFIKKELTLKVIENPQKSENSNVIFASLKQVILEKRAQKDAEFINKINVDDILKGKVTSILKTGIVIDVDGYSAFVHSSQLSWKPIKDISKEFKVGEVYDFLVLEVNRATNKAIIGHKELTETPIQLAQKKYSVGDVVNGEVVKVFDYGAMVRLDENIDGLVHISELSNRYLKDANEVIKVGDKVDVKILNFDNNRIKLSIKALMTNTDADAKTNENTEKKSTKKQQPEQSEWRSDVQSSATIGDLFKDLEEKK